MEDFDPNNPGEGSSGDKQDDTMLPPGRYILACGYLGPDKKGKGKHRCKFEVIAGPGKGRAPWWNLDVGSHPRARAILAAYCKGIGNMDRLDLSDLKQLVARFKGQPFVATLKDDSWQGNDGLVKQNGFAAIHSPEEWTDLERQLIYAWKQEREQQAGSDAMGGDIPQDGQGTEDKVPF